MPPRDTTKLLAGNFVTHLSLLRQDVSQIQSLNGKQRKAALKKIINMMINLPLMPEYLEAMLFGFIVEAGNHFLEAKFGKKEKRCPKCGEIVK